VPTGVALNLAVLGLFKYADFFGSTLSLLSGQGYEPWGIILPLGISFFTFQQISYLVDLRREGAPLYGLRDYLLYVTFFPQLIAGPIVRHDEIIGQFARSPLREGLSERLGRGAVLFVIGLCKKVLLADPLADVADPLFAAAGAGTTLGFTEGWGAVIAFGLQIYYDFSAYTDMALGLGLVFGFVLPANFDMPYRASSIRDFWRRWHMTLSRFLRDYLYIPLGGSRRGALRQAAAIFVTMLLGGLWHGAAWTFVAWGALHGAALAVNHAWRRAGLAMHPLFGWSLTMLVVGAGWALFRATSFDGAWQIWTAMIGASGLQPQAQPGGVRGELLLAVAGVLAVVGPSSQRFAIELIRPWRWGAALTGIALGVVVLRLAGGSSEAFVYFQF
jgi:D-alanyl-lipoteichoic acid acyltransferase DltB (MBOAT superfamily)